MTGFLKTNDYDEKQGDTMLFTSILMPTDFSRNSAEAYEFALNFAKRYSAKLHILHVLEPLTQNSESINHHDRMNLERDRIFNAEEELERFINKFSNAHVEICRNILQGRVHEEIIKYAKSENIDLIIIATHGKTNLYHSVAGNVAKKVLKYSETQVVCIKTNISTLPPKTVVQENLAENWVG
ncbi:MAG: universal stress protein [Ignavibacteria bacterium]